MGHRDNFGVVSHYATALRKLLLPPWDAEAQTRCGLAPWTNSVRLVRLASDACFPGASSNVGASPGAPPRRATFEAIGADGGATGVGPSPPQWVPSPGVGVLARPRLRCFDC